VEFRPLLVFANAYDCKPSIEALKKLSLFDQLWVNYVPYPINYSITERFFESHKEFSHIFYVAPDIVLDEIKFLKLCEYVKENDPAVYGGCCNVDTEKYKDSLACCLKLPDLIWINRRYRWVNEEQRTRYLKNGGTIEPIKFNANFAFVRRDIKQKIPYMGLPYETDERPINEQRGGYACDLAFCHYCDFLEIPILCDFRYKFEHLRYAGALQVGKKAPLIEYKSGGNTHVITDKFEDLLNG